MQSMKSFCLHRKKQLHFSHVLQPVFLKEKNRNHILLKDGHKRISDSANVAITLMIAESRPEEKEVMTTPVMNFLV